MILAFQEGLFEKHVSKGGLIIGGKSMGGRIASQVAAKDSGFAGLVFLGYPLHPPGRPEQIRASHLPSIRAPMLFVQGERDAFRAPEELTPVLRGLKPLAEVCIVKGADHSFKVPKRVDRTQTQVHEFVLDAIEQWVRRTITK